MADTSTARDSIRREIGRSQADLEVAIADMRDTVLRTRETIEETHRLLRQTAVSSC